MLLEVFVMSEVAFFGGKTPEALHNTHSLLIGSAEANARRVLGTRSDQLAKVS